MLINCVAYQNGQKLGDIPISEISDVIARPDCFVWVGLADATPEHMAQMREEFDLHELAGEEAPVGPPLPHHAHPPPHSALRAPRVSSHPPRLSCRWMLRRRRRMHRASLTPRSARLLPALSGESTSCTL